MTVRLCRPVAPAARPQHPRVYPLVHSAAACLLACWLSVTAGAQEREPNARPVRSTTRWGLDLIKEGCERSGSFRNLVERLRASDVIVYVQPAGELPGVMVGVTEFMGVNGAFRYLRVSIGVKTARKKLIALIGHELQHATEIAEALEVVDNVSLAALYRRIGDQSMDGYDSPAARRIGEVVLAELWKWRAAPGPSAQIPTAAAPPAPPPVYPDLTRR